MRFSISLLVFLFVIFTAIDHLSAQDCETVYVDSTPVQDSTGKVSVFAWNTLSDERPDPASSECYYAPYPQPYTHSYYNSVQITSPSGRTITEYGWGDMQGGDGEGIVEADAELDLGCSPSDQNYPDDCEFGTYSVDGPEDSVYCSAMGADFFEGGGSGVTTLVRISDTYYGPPPTVMSDGSCLYTYLACSTGTATCKQGTPGVHFSEGCPSYLHSKFLVIDNACIGTPFDAVASGPGPCN